MDVLDHIKDEHKEFRSTMSKIEVAKGAKKKELFRDFYAELHGHHEAEEKVVFPQVKTKKNEESEDVVQEMIEEHSLGAHQFSVLEKTPVEDKTWDAKFSVLKEVLEHHMKEEETVFIPMAKKLISKEVMPDLLNKFESVLEENEKAMKKKLG